MLEQRQRIWEIDFLRGIAIILMVLFHAIVDAVDFYGYDANYTSGFWYYEGKMAAILFMLIAGISTRFSRNPLKHGLFILGWGMALSIVTYLYNPATYIRFGILHFMGCSFVLYQGMRFWQTVWFVVLGVMIAATAIVLPVIVDFPGGWLLLPLGIIPPGFMSLDYYPLLPWGSFFLAGVFIGRIGYKQPRSFYPGNPHLLINRLGRHSLVIYLLHQPVLLLLFYCFHLVWQS